MNEQYSQSDPQPVPPTEGMTAEQEAMVDRYVNEGLNYTEAKIFAGVLEKEVIVVPVQPAPIPAPKAKREPKKEPKTVDRRTLSPRQQLSADEPPKHIRDEYRKY